MVVTYLHRRLRALDVDIVFDHQLRIDAYRSTVFSFNYVRVDAVHR